MRVIHEKCDPKLADDRKLPYTAYLVQYEVEGNPNYDIAIGDSQVEIFDHYYDKYKKSLKWLKQTQGTVRPNLWNQPAPKRKKRKKPSATPPEAPSS
tara:strand:+ start:2538 stop:2828 length:291 start_codon:yes stop_codon:yes gene_type:complete